MRELQLTQGQVAMLEDADCDKFSTWNWHAFWNHHTKSFYARRSIRTGRRSLITVWLHREVLGLSVEDKRKGDHINGNTFDCRRENLRIATAAENSWNRKLPKNSTSGVKGVKYHKLTGKWQADITVRGVRFYLGLHSSIEAARIVVDSARQKLHGEFARTA